MHVIGAHSLCRALRSLAFGLVTIGVTGTANGQPATGGLEGRLLDDSGAPVAGAKVVVRGTDLLGERAASTNADGYFRVLSLPVGFVRLTISHPSFQTVHFEDVAVALGKTTSLDETRLSPETEAPEQVVVVGRRLVSDPSSTELGGNLTSQSLERLPNDRDYLSVLQYLPHANTSFHIRDNTNIGGASGLENAVLLDGMNVTDPLLGDGATRLPLNFVREIELKAGGYQAEYGRASGGVVNVVTHSGSNEHRGHVFGFFSNNDFSASRNRGFLELPSTDFSRYDVGGSAGGPIVRDKLWYFAAYDPSVESESLELASFGVHEDKRVTHQFAAKLSWRVGADTRLDATLLGDPTSHDRVADFFGDSAGFTTLFNPDPMLGKQTLGGYSVAATVEHFVSEEASFAASFGYLNRRAKLEPATERGWNEMRFIDLDAQTLEGGFGGWQDFYSERIAGKLVSTLLRGRHTIKAGIEYEHGSLTIQDFWQTRSGGSGIGGLRGGTFLTVERAFDYDVAAHLPSAFVQDSWLVSDKLRLNAGLRWDGVYFVDPGGGVRLQITDQLQPRVGVAIQPRISGREKVFGSYGRIYGQPPLATVGLYFSEGQRQGVIVYDSDPRLPQAVAIDSFGTALTRVIDGDVRGTYVDEFVLGYEQHLGRGWKLGASGTLRELGDVLEDAFSEDQSVLIVGNPGSGRLSHLPELTRRYIALQLSIEKQFGPEAHAAMSYVLSRSRGSYPGLFSPEEPINLPHSGQSNDLPEQFVYATGRLPNDRTHVLKMYGSYGFNFGLDAGGFFTWQSGTPFGELSGTSWDGCFPSCKFISERGSVGRTPSIWDLSFRFSYTLQNIGLSRVRPRLLVDILHVFGQKERTVLDEVHFFDDALTALNPTYLEPVHYQPPMTVRVGIETSF